VFCVLQSASRQTCYSKFGAAGVSLNLGAEIIVLAAAL
jgi:hypothetical protein